MRKTNPRSKMSELTPLQQAEVANRLMRGGKGSDYMSVRAWLLSHFRLSISKSALHDFYKRVSNERIELHFMQAAATARSVTTAASEMGADFDEATMSLIGKKAFEAAASEKLNPKQVTALLNLFLKAFKAKTEDKKVTALLEKARKADEAKAVTENPTLTDAEKAVRMKNLFGAPA